MNLGRVRILIYIDDDLLKDGEDMGTDRMRQLVQVKTKHFLDVDIKLAHRHDPIDPVKKITNELLSNWDELWVFGYRQANVISEKTMDMDNELTDDEILALRRWMDAGNGILISGDHSEKDPNSTSADPETFLGLGKAIGEKIPRAGQLRIWKGPPTIGPGENQSFSSLEGARINDLSLDSRLQSDQIPQHLSLVRNPIIHELFWWDFDTTGRPIPILKFPDHMHEGGIAIPAILNNEWPEGSQKPEVVARGTDKRNNKLYDLIAVYDGDPFKVGRIVADSSWHHYLNENLKGFRSDKNGVPIKESDLDQISQYYANLVLWLAPKSLRDKLKRNVLFELAKHPAILELKEQGATKLGEKALQILNQEIGITEIHWLFRISEEKKGGPVNELLLSTLIGEETGRFSLIDRLGLLGFLIQRYHQQFKLLTIEDPGQLRENPISADEHKEICLEAFKSHLNFISNWLVEVRELSL